MSIQDIINQITPIANQYNIPGQIWQSIIQTESGFNPTAIGDNGTSFGLFQLHYGGQAPANISADALFNPVINAQYALPYIGQAWSQLGPSFDDSLSWWERFAVASGHPGGSVTNQSTINEAQQLKSVYDTGVTTTGNSLSLGSGTTGNVPLSATSNSSGGIGTFFQNIGFTTIIFLIAIVLLVVGFILVM
jgi:hypothetical protein